MSGPVPSPSMKGTIGFSGTTSLPLRMVILAPLAGGVIFNAAAVDIEAPGPAIVAGGVRILTTMRAHDTHTGSYPGGRWILDARRIRAACGLLDALARTPRQLAAAGA